VEEIFTVSSQYIIQPLKKWKVIIEFRYAAMLTTRELMVIVPQ
jgi:hypothetical protein